MTDREKLKRLWGALEEPYRERRATIHVPGLHRTFEFDRQGRIVSIRVGSKQE